MKSITIRSLKKNKNQKKVSNNKKNRQGFFDKKKEHEVPKNYKGILSKKRQDFSSIRNIYLCSNTLFNQKSL